MNCVVPQCSHVASPKAARSLCSMHYHRYRATGDVGEAEPRHRPVGTVCISPGCTRHPVLKCLCRAHYARAAKADPLIERPIMYRHGMTGSRTYRSWQSMRRRCLNPNNPKYPVYGGAGITVCGRWSQFTNFLADMGLRPLRTTLDRIDPDGNYEPANCRWAPPSIQSYNTRRASELSHCRGTHKQRSRFIAEISKDRITHYLGSYSTRDEAAWMYDQWAIALYGDAARTNFTYEAAPFDEATAAA